MSTDSRLGLLGAAVLALVACEDDGIRSYRVPKEEKPRVIQKSGPVIRMIAAIVPRGEKMWFFKMNGPAAPIDEQKEKFEAFIRSIRFSGDKPTWIVPETWKEMPGSEMRYATFQVGSIELTVIPLDALPLLANVNRWRSQLGLPPIDESKLGPYTRSVPVDGATATIVELTSPESEIGKPVPSRAPLTYVVPPGWTEQASSPGMILATFYAEEGGRRAEVTIVPLGGAAGGVAQNINRWRGQIGLDPMPEDQLEKEIRPIEVAGTRASYIDILGPESGGPKRQRILAVIVVRSDKTWFFKMKGPADLVGAQKSAFEAFVRSVKFEA